MSATDSTGLATAIVPSTDLATGLNHALAMRDNTTPANAAAKDPVQSALASLAADSHQVTPLIRYAPGDGPVDGNGAAPGN